MVFNSYDPFIVSLTQTLLVALCLSKDSTLLLDHRPLISESQLSRRRGWFLEATTSGDVQKKNLNWK